MLCQCFRGLQSTGLAFQGANYTKTRQKVRQGLMSETGRKGLYESHLPVRLHGLAAKPWIDAGYECYSFDAQHPSTTGLTNQHTKSNYRFHPARKLLDAKYIAGLVGGGVEFVMGFPECTDLTSAGARHFDRKRIENPLFQLEAIELCDLVRCVGILANCPWAFENPVGVLSTQYRKPDFMFDPCDYGGYLPENDMHPLYPEIYPARDAYKKKTCIWSGNGFAKPEPKPVTPVSNANPGWEKLGGNSLRTKNIRSATPRGFAQAVFKFNHKNKDV